MKNIIISILLCFVINNLMAQDRLTIDLSNGINATYYLRGQIHFPQENSYFFGYIGYYNENNFANSVGLTYETRSFNILEETIYFVTQNSLSYRSTYFDGSQKNILISNDIYLPKRVKEKKIRCFFGVRNSLILYSSLNDEILPFTFYKYQFGLTGLLDYRITDKWYLGLNAYASTRKLGDNRTGTKIHTVEALLKISYEIW